MKASEEHSDARFYEMAMEEAQTERLNRGLMSKALLPYLRCREAVKN